MVSSGPRSYCCHECRRRKVKVSAPLSHRSLMVLTHSSQCDGLKPACQRCTKRGKICTGFPSTFKFLGNQIHGKDQIQSSQRWPITNPAMQTRITGSSRKEYRSTQHKQSAKSHQDTSLSPVNLPCFPSRRNIPSKSGIQCQENPPTQEDASLHLSNNPQQCLAKVPKFTIQLESGTRTDLTNISSSQSTYCYHSREIERGGTTPSSNDWSTISSPETGSPDSHIVSPTYRDRDLEMVRVPSEIISHCTPNIQLGSSPAFLADEQLDAYWEMITSEYVASCQTNDSSAADSNFFPMHRICVGDTNKGPGGLQVENQSLYPDPDPEGMSCGDLIPNSLSPNELYLCNFFL